MRKYPISKRLMVILGVLFLCTAPVVALADGTDTLDPPSIPIAEGSGIVSAGVGLAEDQPGTIDINVPGEVVQVLLYWEGQMSTDVTGDSTIVVNGTEITGDLIGGPLWFFSGAYSSAFRADITGLGLVGPGSNTLSVVGLDFTKVANGAGVLVIFDDGTPTTPIQLRDGLDLAFVRPIGAIDPETDPQTFNFAASAVDRTASLDMFFSSVSGRISGAGADRPTSIEVTVDGTKTVFSNLLASVDGEEWDTVSLDNINIPAGATSLTVQAFARDDNGSGKLPASFAWTAAGLFVPPPPLCSIGDYVWEDANRNGCQDDEDGINGVTVELYEDCTFTNKLTDTTTATNSVTNLDGFYQFDNLVCGQNYGIRFVDNPDDIYEQTEPNSCPNIDNNDDTKDSDCEEDGRVCATAGTDSQPGTINDTIDCGYVCEGKIGDFVWLDENENGCQDDNGGLPGIKVELFESCQDPPAMENKVDEDFTNGTYMFTGLCPGNYLVKFADEPPNTDFDSCFDDSNNPNNNNDTTDSDCDGPDECVELTRDNFINLDTDCGKVGPECGISVTKGCEIPVPGPPSVGKCDGKLKQFTVVWNGSDPIDIAVGDGLTGSSQTSAMPGDEVTFFTDGSTNDTIVNISGSTISGQSTFHVSCSDKDMDGDTATNEDQQQVSPIGRDCGKDQGDGKGDSGFINQWLLEGFVDNANAVLDCTVDTGVGDPSCTFQAVAADCDFPVNDPDILTFRVTGGDCSASDNDQEPNKTECTGGFIDADLEVQVSVNGDPRFTLQPGETFDVERGGDPEIELFQDDVTQFNKFHASCSQPLQAGDRYGANELVALDGNGLGTTVVYSYQVSNAGPGDLTGIKVTDDQLGTVPGSPIDLAEGASETLTATAFITQTTTNTASAVASPTCAANSDPVEVIVSPPPQCDVSIAFKELKDDAIKWTLTNGNQSKATLDTLTLNFPEDFGAIKEVKLDGTIFKSGDSNTYPSGVPSGATIGPGDWTEDEVAKRQLERGEERTLEVKFTQKDNNASQGDFDLIVTFEEGCRVDF